MVIYNFNACIALKLRPPLEAQIPVGVPAFSLGKNPTQNTAMSHDSPAFGRPSEGEASPEPYLLHGQLVSHAGSGRLFHISSLSEGDI
jgi:hypothetical protein